MVIKVISEGPVKTEELVCSKCYYKLSYTPEDVRVHGGYYMGDYDVTSYIDCPRCKHANVVRNK